MKVLEWTESGKVIRPLALAFEDSLYKLYKPEVLSAAEPDSDDLELDRKFKIFKQRNMGKSVHDAAKAVKDFMVWQHNFAEFEKPDDITLEQFIQARRVEHAFLLGAAGVALEAFSLADDYAELLMLNIVGSFYGTDPDDIKAEIETIFAALDSEVDATRIGLAAMTDFFANGKNDNNKVHLAALQKKCWI